jgi:hypothetical protein
MWIRDKFDREEWIAVIFILFILIVGAGIAGYAIGWSNNQQEKYEQQQNIKIIEMLHNINKDNIKEENIP